MNNKWLMMVALLFVISQSMVSPHTIEQKSNETQEIHSKQSQWTMLFYFAADNPRSYEIESNLDLWTSIGSSEDFTIVTLVDGAEFGDTSYYVIEHNSLVALSWPEPESDMGDARTLERFLNYSLKNFPADNYALFILSTHGSGWQGLGSDTSNTTGYDHLSLLDMKDYKQVFGKIKKEFNTIIDVIAFDICVTGMIEVAYQMKNYCDFMIATEEHGFSQAAESEEGVNLEWNYRYFLSNLKENPELNPEEFVQTVVDSYTPGTYICKILERFPAPDWYPIIACFSTISTMNLSRFDDVIDAMSNLSSLLINDFQKYSHSLTTARDEVREYGKLYRKFWFLPSMLYYLHLESLGYNCYIDVYDFIQKIKTYSDDEHVDGLCSEVLEALDGLIIGNNVLPTDSSHGLSIYFPEYTCQYDVSIWRLPGVDTFEEMNVHYDEIDFSIDTPWNEFIETYLSTS